MKKISYLRHRLYFLFKKKEQEKAKHLRNQITSSIRTNLIVQNRWLIESARLSSIAFLVRFLFFFLNITPHHTTHTPSKTYKIRAYRMEKDNDTCIFLLLLLLYNRQILSEQTLCSLSSLPFLLSLSHSFCMFAISLYLFSLLLYFVSF